MNKLLAWDNPSCAKFLLSVRRLLTLRRVFALPVLLLMLWQAVQVPLGAAKPSFARAAIASQALGQTAGNVDASGAFSVGGGYSRSMVFYQRGTSVSGTYSFNGETSSFSGSVSGYVLTGTFSYSGTSRNYTATYAADGQSFAGSDPWGSFTGTKQSTAIVRVIPTQAVVKVGGTLSIDGLVGGVADKGITWSATGGTISNGSYTAPATAGVYTVTAASSVQPSVKAITTIQVTTDGNMDASGAFSVGGAYSRSMVFYQRGTSVTGTYSFNGETSSFSGSVSGYVLTGTFSYSGTSRNFTATYAADGQSFAGSDPWGAFTGTKQSTAIVRVIPAQAIVKVGGTLSIDGLVGGVVDKGIIWTTTGGTVSNGIFTAPTTGGVYTVTATSNAQSGVKATTVIQVTADGNMDASGAFSVGGGYSRSMVFYQRGTSVTGTYSFNGETSSFSGSVSGYVLTGTFSYSGTSRNFTATYAADGQSFAGSDPWGSFTATKQSTISVRIVPGTPQTLPSGGTASYSADVAGSFNKAVSWSASAGTIANGLYTAPSKPGIYTLTATSQAAPTASAQATVYVGTWTQAYGAWNFNEGSGFLASDSTGLGFDGMLAGNPAWVGGKVSKCLKFDGALSRVEVPSLDVFKDRFSVSAWVKLDEVGKSRVNTIMGAGRASCYQALHCCVNQQDKPYFGFYCADLTGSATLSAGVWTHLVFTFDGSKKRIYVNGVLDSSQDSGALTVTDKNVVIGNHPFSSGIGFKGLLDEVQVFNRALVDVEVAALYASTVTVSISPGVSTLAVGQSQVFTASVVGATHTAVTWELPDANSGAITPAGVYTAPASVPSGGATYRVLARSVADTAQTDSVSITVKPFVRVIPGTINLSAKGIYPFQAEVTGLANADVTWSSTWGTMSPTGLFTAPSTAGGSVTIKATSVADNSKYATATAKIVAGDIGGNNGLVGYWKFDYDALDSSGNANHATLANGATWVPGKRGGAAHFDGLKASAEIPMVNGFRGPFTVSAWVKFDAVNRGAHNAILGHGANVTNQGLRIGESGGKAFFGFIGNDLVGSTLLQANLWTHLAFVYDGTQKRIYVNGVLDAAQASVAYGSSLTNAEIGRYPFDSSSTCLGLLDEVRVYERALSDTEISGVFAASPTVSISPRAAVISVAQTQAFTAQVSGSSNTALTWSLPSSGSGTLSASGLYTPPASIPYHGVKYTVKALSQADTSQSDTVQVTVKYPVYVTPTSLRVPAKGRAQFSAETTGLTNSKVTWTSTWGTISSEGLFTAPESAGGTVTITATSVEDPSKSATATVTVSKAGLSPDVYLPLDEGTGTTVADVMGSGVVGTLANTPDWVAGKFGKGLDFKTGSPLVTLNPAVSLGGAWTISAWFQYPIPSSGTYHTLTRGYSGDHQIIVNTDQVSLGCYDNGGAGFRDSGFKMSSLQAGWHHLAAVAIGGSTQFYVDGLPVGNVIPWQSATDVYAVGNCQGSSQAFGVVDELQIFRRALSPSEISSLASGLKIQISPGTASIAPGGKQAFTATVTGASNTAVTWELPDTASGTITTTGIYTAPRIPYEGVRYRVLARSVQDPLQTATAWVTVSSASSSLRPLLHLPFQEGSGSTTQDASGHAYQGTLVNSPVWESVGKVGKALRFSGTQVVKVPSFPAMRNAFSASIWIYPTDKGTQNPQGGTLISREGEFELARYQDGTIQYALANSSPGWTWKSTGFTAPLNQWTHLAWTYDSSTGFLKVYANGTLVHSLTGSGVVGDADTSRNELWIGGRQGDNQYFQGLLDEARLYDRAISEGEVASLYNLAGVDIYPLEAGLRPGQEATFQALVPGLADQSVSWELPVANSGSIAADGTYTAPGTLSSGDDAFPLIARSVADTTRTGSALVRVRRFPTSDTALAGYWAFNEKAGTTVLDQSQNANHGLVTDGVVARASGRSGMALVFDGANGRVTIPNQIALNPQSLSLSLWLRLDRDPAFDTTTNSWRSILHKGDFYGGGSGYSLYMEKDRGLGFDTGTGSSDRWWPQGLKLPMGEWTLLVLTYDAASGLKCAYQDGVLMDSKRVSALPLQANISSLYLNNPSAYLPNGYGNFPGAMDEVRVYNRALGASEVTALYDEVVSVRVSPTSPTLLVGQTQAFTARVGGTSNTSVTWSVLDSNGGSMDAMGLYTAPASIPSQGAQVRIQAQSVANPSAKDVVTLTLKNPVSVSPLTATVPVYGQLAFSAEVSGLASPEVTWSTNWGNISSTGVLTAPGTAGGLTVTATSKADPKQSASAKVTVTAASTLPAAYFPFEEGTGTLTADSAGHGYQGLLQNGAQWISGYQGKGLDLGANANAWLALAPGVDLGEAWTISSWFYYPLPATGTWHSLTRGTTADHQILVHSDQVTLGLWDSTANAWRSSGYSLANLGAGWHQVSAVGIQDTTTYYVDGQPVGTPVPYQSRSDVGYLGGDATVSPGRAFGALDELKIYRRALGPVEISQQFVSTLGVTAKPVNPTLILGQSQAFSATVTGSSDQAVTWSVQESGGGSISATGVYTAPASIPAEGTVYHIVALSHADPTKSAVIPVTIKSPIVVTPATATVNQGATLAFSAATTNLTSTAVKWSVSAGGGSILEDTGVYTAPGTAGIYTLTATSVSDPSKTGTARVWVPLGISIFPTQSALITGGRLQFSAQVNGSSSQAVTWSLVEGLGGTLSASGLYTASTTPGTYHISATTQATPRVAAVAPVTVVRDNSYLLDPESIRVKPGATVAFKVLGPDLGLAQITWATTGGSISSAGLLRAPSAVGTYTVSAVVTTDVARVVGATVIVAAGSPVDSVTVSPVEVDLPKGGSKTFTAKVNGGVTGTVTWSCDGGSINASTGAYTAPNAFGTYTVKATSTEDSSAYGTATVTVKAAAGTDKSFSYDLNGNMTSDGERTFEWDAENRLVAVVITATGHRSEFGYDGLGRRVSIKELDPDANKVLQTTSDKKYLWDGVEIAEERDATGAIVTKRFYSQGFVDTDGTILFYTKDHLGSIRELMDGSQTVRARYDYDPYGRMTKIGGDKDSAFTYTGHFWHAQSGLNLTLFRAYEPNLGRWISRDQIPESFASAMAYSNEASMDSSNMYNYAFNNPVLYYDPDGKLPIVPIFIAALVIGVAWGLWHLADQIHPKKPFEDVNDKNNDAYNDRVRQPEKDAQEAGVDGARNTVLPAIVPDGATYPIDIPSSYEWWVDKCGKWHKRRKKSSNQPKPNQPQAQ